MNGYPRVAPPPPLPPPRRRWWPWVLGGTAVVAAVLTAVIYRPFPTDEEKKYFGWWFGSDDLGSERPRAWIAHFGEDAKLRIQFGQYSRKSPTEKWTLTTSEETGVWRVRDGVQSLASEDRARPSGWWERIERVQNTGDWRRVHYYRTIEINEREMRYVGVTDGHEYRALRSQAPVALPPDPLLPDLWPAPAAR